jgi:flagellin-like hook-associated protein FlgL
VQISNSYDGSVLNVDVDGIARTGAEDVKYNGTFDAFTTLSTLRNLLANDEGLPTQTVRDRIAQMLTEVDSAHDAVLDGLRELGFRSSSMEVLKNRVDGLRVSRTESLSLVQDTDIAEAILEMQRQELSYQAALQVGSRVIQTSLQSFLG